MEHHRKTKDHINYLKLNFQPRVCTCLWVTLTHHFQKAYWLSIPAFNQLLERIKPVLEKNMTRAITSSGSASDMDTSLSVCMRWLAWGSSIDIFCLHMVFMHHYGNLYWHSIIVRVCPFLEMTQINKKLLWKAVRQDVGESSEGAWGALMTFVSKPDMQKSAKH